MILNPDLTFALNFVHLDSRSDLAADVAASADRTH